MGKTVERLNGRTMGKTVERLNGRTRGQRIIVKHRDAEVRSLTCKNKSNKMSIVYCIILYDIKNVKKRKV